MAGPDPNRYPEAWDGEPLEFLNFGQMFIESPRPRITAEQFIDSEGEPSPFQRAVVGLALAGSDSWIDRAGDFLAGFSAAFDLISQIPALSLGETLSDILQLRMIEQILSDMGIVTGDGPLSRSFRTSDSRRVTVSGVGERFYNTFFTSFKGFFEENILPDFPDSGRPEMRIGAGWALRLFYSEIKAIEEEVNRPLATPIDISDV